MTISSSLSFSPSATSRINSSWTCSSNRDFSLFSLISFETLTSDPKYHKWILQERINLYRNKTKFDNDSIHYDLKSNTMDYLKSMFYLSRKFLNLNKKIILNLYNYYKL